MNRRVVVSVLAVILVLAMVLSLVLSVIPASHYTCAITGQNIISGLNELITFVK